MPLTVERNPWTIMMDLFFWRRSPQMAKEWVRDNNAEHVDVVQHVHFNHRIADSEILRRQKLIAERDNIERQLRGELLNTIKADWIEYCQQQGGNEQDILDIEGFFAEKKSCKKLLACLEELHSFNKTCKQTNLPAFIRDYIFNNAEKTAEVAIRKKTIEEKDYHLLLMTPHLRHKMATEQPLCNKLAIEAVEQQLQELQLDNSVLPGVRL